MTGRGLRFHAATAVFAVAALLGAACGGNEGGGDGEQASQEERKSRFDDLQRVAEPNPCTADPGVTDTEILVGGMWAQSGPQGVSFGPAIEGVKARFEKANQEGEVGKRKLVLRTADDAGDAARNLEVARQLVEANKVFGIIEISSQADSSAKYLADQGVPVTGWHVGRPVWNIHPNMFAYRIPASAEPDRNYTTRNADLVKELGGKKVALIGGGNQSSVSFMTRAAATVEADPALEMVYLTTDIQVGNTDFTAVVERIKGAGADSVFTGMDFLQNAALSDQLKRAGVNVKVLVFPGGYDSRVLKLPGVEGAVFGIDFKPFSERTPSFQDFDKWMPPGAVRNQTTYVAWLSANMFVEGIKQAGINCPTRKGFTTNLRLVESYNANGAFEPVNLKTVFGTDYQCLYYVRVQNAQFVPLFGAKELCGKPFNLRS